MDAGLDTNEKKEAYKADITYGTNSEFGFDFLRDNIVIPTKEETKRWKEKEQEAEAKPYEEGEAEMFYVQYAESDSSTVGDEKSGKVNLNTADEKMLCTLPGIGTSRAKSIIDYRTKNGVFKRIEDVMKVSGIKEAAFEKIKDFITVSD